MKRILVYSFVSGLITAIQGQNFALATFQFKEGLKTEMCTYNKKNDLLSRDFQKVIDTSSSAGYIQAKCKFVSRQYTVNDSLNFTYEMFVKKGNLIVYPGDFLPNMHFNKIFVDGDHLQLPDSLYIGQTIPSFNMKVIVNVDKGFYHNLSIRYSFLKVEKKDTIYCASDTFNCFKITYFSEQELDPVDSGTISMLNNLFFPILGIFIGPLGGMLTYGNFSSVSKGSLWVCNGLTIKTENSFLKKSKSSVLTRIQLPDL